LEKEEIKKEKKKDRERMPDGMKESNLPAACSALLWIALLDLLCLEIIATRAGARAHQLGGRKALSTSTKRSKCLLQLRRKAPSKE